MQGRYLAAGSFTARAVLAFVCFYLLIPGGGIARARSFAEIVESRLGGKFIANARAGDLLRAVRDSVAADRGNAAAILTDVLAVTRGDERELAGQLAAAAITGLGRAPSPVTLAELVRVAVYLEPAAAPSVVREAVRVSSRENATLIVNAAALGSADTSIENRRAIVRAAVEARPDYFLNPLILQAALDRTFSTNPRRGAASEVGAGGDNLEGFLEDTEMVMEPGMGGNLGGFPLEPPTPQPASP